jgi:ribonuclease P/MRP protein subunit POP5
LKQSVLNNFGDTGWVLSFMFLVNYFCFGSRSLFRNFDGYSTIRHAQLAAIAHIRQVVARYRALAKNPGTFAICFERPPLEQASIVSLVAAYQSYNTFLEITEHEIEALQD